MFENLIKLLLLLFNVPCFIHTKNNNKLGCTEHIKKDKRERRTARERRSERRTWSEVSEGCLQRPLVMSWSVLSSSWSFGTERNVFFCPYLAKSWPAILGPRPLKMRHKWPVWATLSFTPTGERSRKKKSDDAGFNRRLSIKRKERERGKGKRKGWVDEIKREWRRREPSSWVAGGSLSSLNSSFTSSSDPTLPAQRQKELLNKSVKSNASTVNHKTLTFLDFLYDLFRQHKALLRVWKREYFWFMLRQQKEIH